MKKILFVCTGNTCRSPMAECMMCALIRERRPMEEVRVFSAGINALSGAWASDGALRAMARRGLSLREHKSRPVTLGLLEDMDCVVGLTEHHIEYLQAMYPQCKTPMRFFDDPPIADPFGRDDSAYETAARDIERQLPALFDAIIG